MEEHETTLGGPARRLFDIFVCSHTNHARLVSSLHKELAAVGVLSSVRHRQQKRFVVLQCQVLVVESSSVNRLAAGAVSTGEVARLNHKILHNSMKNDALKVSEH